MEPSDGGPGGLAIPGGTPRAGAPPIRVGISRRQFLLEVGALSAIAAAAGCSPVTAPAPDASQVAAGTGPATTDAGTAGPSSTGTIADVQHVVILMEENRSFDHLFGMLPGVRGLGDRQAVRFLSGRTVFQQPSDRIDGVMLPWHLDTSRFNAQFAEGLPHDWKSGHLAWHDGAWDRWVAAKGEQTMGYLTQDDIPYHYAIAEAYTICDHYFCSAFTGTVPNRLYLLAGTIDPAGSAGGPAIANPGQYQVVYDWTTYPERLQRSGVSWKVYANDEVGNIPGDDGWVGDFGCNPLWNFQQYHRALESADPAARQLAGRAAVTDGWLPNSGMGRQVDHVLAEFIADCAAGTLPKVSWIVAPFWWSQHPTASPDYGAHYVNRVVRALAANTELWRSTVLLLNYDENDGYFDHVVGPMPEPETPDEFVGGEPIGAGPRVPMIVVSPWTRGGWVNSQAFDHTSVLQFLETWTGVAEPNISRWRRQVFGDLTSCFDFANPDFSIPSLPDTEPLLAIADSDRTKPTVRAPVDGAQTEMDRPTGTRKARSIPYRQNVTVEVDRSSGLVSATLTNAGAAGVSMLVYPDPPKEFAATPFTVTADADRKYTWDTSGTSGRYGFTVYGPDRFVRRFAGSVPASDVDDRPAPLASVMPLAAGLLSVTLDNRGAGTVEFLLSANDFGTLTRRVAVAGGQQSVVDWATVDGYYDLLVTADSAPDFEQRFAGRTW